MSHACRQHTCDMHVSKLHSAAYEHSEDSDREVCCIHIVCVLLEKYHYKANKLIPCIYLYICTLGFKNKIERRKRRRRRRRQNNKTDLCLPQGNNIFTDYKYTTSN